MPNMHDLALAYDHHVVTTIVIIVTAVSVLVGIRFQVSDKVVLSRLVCCGRASLHIFKCVTDHNL